MVSGTLPRGRTGKHLVLCVETALQAQCVKDCLSVRTRTFWHTVCRNPHSSNQTRN